ncbi:MAG TPA: DAK2 domain-containing protein [Candidatus Wildermuthbacteria bacterium]|nr:DAK2 domain-containing protein [Candidatus Wildermuthbacteria bacterium]
MSAEALIWIIWSYLVGSLPFGYWITKLTSQENLLLIGYKKSSGSNVIKYVGVWQGVLTILLDALKGFLVVWLAQELGLVGWIQVAAALAVVIGHNWSPFLNFAGGRGIAALMGALLAFSLPITAISLIVFVAIFAVWDASIGTLLVFPVVILLSYIGGSFETMGMFALLVMFPVLFKRLSPLEEISNATLFVRRLLRDGDCAVFDFRIVRLIERYPTAFIPVHLVIGLIKRARGYVPPVLSLSPQDMAGLLSSGAKKAADHQEEVNRINVFPVADKDTGYNLAATTVGIESAIAKKEYRTFKNLAKDVRLSAVKSARGNAGMIYVGFLLGFFERIQEESIEIDAQIFAEALLISKIHARSAIHNPVDGTMLDVIDAAAKGAENYIKEGNNIIELLENSHKEAKAALKATTEKLEVLKKNNVVDAGALGFVRILEGWIENLKGDVPVASVMAPVNLSVEQAPPRYRYCVQIGFQNEGGNIQRLREELSLLGNSMEVLEAEGRVRLHIHTDQPEAVKAKLSFATDINVHIEDMRSQVEGTSIKPLGLVVGDTASLPQSFIEKNNITEIPFVAQFPNGKKVTKENAYQKMRDALKEGTPLPTTTNPSPASIMPVSYIVRRCLLESMERAMREEP